MHCQPRLPTAMILQLTFNFMILCIRRFHWAIFIHCWTIFILCLSTVDWTIYRRHTHQSSVHYKLILDFRTIAAIHNNCNKKRWLAGWGWKSSQNCGLLNPVSEAVLAGMANNLNNLPLLSHVADRSNSSRDNNRSS